MDCGVNVNVDKTFDSKLLDKTIYSNNTFYTRRLNLPPQQCTTDYTIAKVDSGASNHYFKERDLSYP